MLPHPVAPRRREPLQRRRTRRAASVALAGAALVAVAGCSGDGGDIADVTLPKLNSTTTTSVPPDARPRPAGEAEPLHPDWTVQIGGAGDDTLRSVTGSEDSVVTVGSTTGQVSIPNGPNGPNGPTDPTVPTEPAPGAVAPGGTDVLVAHVSTEGEVRSAATAGSDGQDVAHGVAPSGTGIMACGATTGQLGARLAGGTDLWCSLLGADGTEPLGQVTQFGGTDVEELTGVSGDAESDRVYASGLSRGLLPGAQDPAGRGLGSGDAIVLQLGSGGDPVWARQFGTPVEDGALGVTISPDDDGIVVGYTDGDLGRASSGGRDAWISRFDPAGRQRWITQFGSAGSDTLTSVTTAGEARRGTELFIGAGTTDGQLDQGSADGDGPGAEAPPLGEGAMSDAFAAAFGPDGTLVWTTALASPAEDQGTAVVADGEIIYVAGTTRGDLGELLPETGPGGGADGFLAALDAASGEILWVSRFGSSGDEEITGATTTEDGLLVLSGTTTGQMSDTAPGGGVDGFLIAFPLSSAGGGAASSV